MRISTVRLLAAALVLHLAVTPAFAAGPIEAAGRRAVAQVAAQGVVGEPALWRTMLAELEPGVLVVVRLKDGSRTTGTVLQVGDETFTFKPRTRIPVAAREVPLREVATIERQTPGMSPAKKVLIGTGIGVGTLFLITAILAAAYGFD
jgi:hypothetical protein